MRLRSCSVQPDVPVTESKLILNREKTENGVLPLVVNTYRLSSSRRCDSITASVAALNGRMRSSLVLFLVAGSRQSPLFISLQVILAASSRRAPVNNKNLISAGNGPSAFVFQTLQISSSVRTRRRSLSPTLVRAIPLTSGLR